MDAALLKLVSENDQDWADLEQWWRSASNEAKALVWGRIQTEYQNPVMEIMSRFAQIGFSEAAIRFSPK